MEFQPFADQLIGKALAHVWQGDGAALFLEFGELAPGTIRRNGSEGNKRGDITLMLDADWRVEDDGSINCGSRDAKDAALNYLADLIGCTVTSVTVVGSVGEIEVVLSNHVRIVSFETSRGDADWGLLFNRATPPLGIGVRHGKLIVEAARK